MENFKNFYLEENRFKKFYDSLKRIVISVINRGIRRYKKVGAGKSITMNFKVPKPLTEGIQDAKKGGEVAEGACLLELSTKLEQFLSKQKTHGEVYFVNRGGRLSISAWKDKVYKTDIEGFKKSVTDPKERASITKWQSHGVAAGLLMFEQITTELGDDAFITDFELEHLGVSETGFTKTDFSIKMKKFDTKRLTSTINVSMKATKDKSPYSTPSQAYQSGYSAIMMSLLTGKYTKEYENIDSTITSYTAQLKKLERITDPDERIKQLAKVKKTYEGTYLYKLDQIGKDIGYWNNKGKNKYLGEYLNSLDNYFKEYKKNKKMGQKNGTVSKLKNAPPDTGHIAEINDYILIIHDVLETKVKSDKQGVIQAILKFGGIEKDLYYLAAGVNPNDKAASAAVSTLYNKDYKEMVKELLDTELDIDFEIKGKKNGASNIVARIKRKTDQTTLVKFDIYKDDKEARISLPTFADQDSQGGKDKLLKKYASGMEDNATPTPSKTGSIPNKTKTPPREKNSKEKGSVKKVSPYLLPVGKAKIPPELQARDVYSPAMNAKLETIKAFITTKNIDASKMSPSLQKKIRTDVVNDGLTPAESFGRHGLIEKMKFSMDSLSEWMHDKNL